MIYMANLEFSAGYFELSFASLEQKYSEWIQTNLVLMLTFGSQTTLLKNKRRISIQRVDFQRFISGIREFVSRVNNRENAFEYLEPFDFVPLELYFSFSCLEGEVDNNLEGEITVRIMVNLDVIETQLVSTYIGSEFNVNINALLTFAQELEEGLPKI